MATTTNFGWETPDDTDLVKDGAAAIRTALGGVDTSFVDLKGGTTGQVLSKASNTDLDYTWVTTDDANAIQNAIVDAKGDLIAASAADTPARLAVGNNGETLVADSSTATGLSYQANWAAGKNKIINGDFGINQRAFTSTTTSGTFGFDRFNLTTGGDGTTTYSAQTFTAGTAPVTGYESTNFAQLVTTGQTNTSVLSSLSQKIESVRTFAAQTITVSFWAKASSGTPNITAFAFQNFGTGGSTGVFTGSTKKAISTSWARYSFTIAVPSISGKTIGTGDHLRLDVCVSAGSTRDAYTDTLGIQTGTFQIWGVQAEAGSVATAFQTATGTLQGETSACQRYYARIGGSNIYEVMGLGFAWSSTRAGIQVKLPVTMRIAPSALDFALPMAVSDSVTATTVTTASLGGDSGKDVAIVRADVASGLTTYRPMNLTANNSTSAYVGFSAEL